MFWQEFLTPMLIYPVFGLSILASIVYLIMQNFFIGWSLYNRWFLDDHSSVCI